jgi:hypothetical protein
MSEIFQNIHLLKIVLMNLKKKDISHYLYPCYILLKNKDMFPGKKKVRGLERHPDIYPFLSIS